MYLNSLQRTQCGDDVVLSGNSILSGELVSIKVKKKDLEAWISGTLIQNAFPYLTKSEREFLISGMSERDWARAFHKED